MSVTDNARWQDRQQLRPEWEPRSRTAAALVPAGSVVLDLGCGAMTLERYLPGGCTYVPSDLVARDERTIVCDLNRGDLPDRPDATLVTMLGVLEYVIDPPAFLARLARLQRPVLLSYCPREFTAHLNRQGLGWLNHFDLQELRGMLQQAGFALSLELRIDPIQVLFRLDSARREAAEKRVLVLSYNNVGNFGDRLGFHVISSVLPSNACVTFAHFEPWDVPEGDFDLAVVGVGNSIFAPLLTDRLLQLIERSTRSIGIFGTQYREFVDATRIGALIDGLDCWFARYEEDALLYGRGKNNVRHLGDWLINAFPLARGSRADSVLKVGDEIWQNLALDRVIQEIQSFRRVHSTRLHPLICALTSAEQVAYTEQRAQGALSGKFRSMLLDVFGRTWPEDTFFDVPREAVAAYKSRVRRSTEALAARLDQLLNGSSALRGSTQ